jgi:hypothetical protein
VRLAGTLHVSLPTDIIQLFGTGSVPVVVAGSVLGVFELGERFASQRAKDALSKWLLTFDVQKAKALPDGTQELFEKIFGERHFSLKCFMRSAAFSLGTMAFIAVLCLLIWPEEFGKMTSTFFEKTPFTSGVWLFASLWLPWSIVIDYASLFKTRVILGILTRLRHNKASVAILGVDYFIYSLLWAVSTVILFGLSTYISNYPTPGTFLEVAFFFASFGFIIGLTYQHSEMVYSIFFWAGFAPSIWMWLYMLALFFTRALLRSEKLVNWLRWALDVEKNPFRSIGAVAATLAFIACVAIILVSAEVSRISAAS